MKNSTMRLFMVRSGSYIVATMLMASVLTAMFGLTSCKADDPDVPVQIKPKEPEQINPPATEIIKLTFEIGSTADILKHKPEIDAKAPTNDSTKSTILIKLLNDLGLTNETKELMFNIPEWAKFEQKGVTIEIGGFKAFSLGGTIVVPADTVWLDLVQPDKGPDGTRFFASLPDLTMFYSKGWGDYFELIKADGGEYGDAYVVECNHPSELQAKAKEAEAALALGQQVAFVINGLYDIDNPMSKLLDPLLANKDVAFYTDNGLFRAGEDSTYIAHPKEFAAALKNFAAIADHYFYVLGKEPGKLDMVAAIRRNDPNGMLRTDTLNASGWNILRGLMPNKFLIDGDLFDFADLTNEPFKGYTKVINIEGLPFEIAPGGWMRPNNLNPEIYSTPHTRELGEGWRALQFAYDPVIGPYYRQFTRGENISIEPMFIDVASGEKIMRLNEDYIKHTYDYNWGNFLANKMQESNRVASRSSEHDMLPILAQYEVASIPVYNIRFPEGDRAYLWDRYTTRYGNPNWLVLVSLATLQEKVIKETFKLYPRDENNIDTGNEWFYINLANINPVMSDEIIDWAGTQTDSYGALRGAIYKPLWLQNYPGVVIRQSVLDAYMGEKKVY